MGKVYEPVTDAEKAEDFQMPPAGMEDAAEDVLRQIEASYKTLDDAEPEILQNLLDKQEWHGFHAYRYEIMDDASVIALYALKPGELKIKAFPNMMEASKWSPREER